MPGTKISELTVMTSVASDDRLMVLDVSDHTMGPNGTNKTITVSDIIGAIHNVTPGTITANKAYIADSDGKVEGVSATQFAMLNITPGSWEASKVLSTDTDNKLEGVTKTQFQMLNVTPGDWEASKVLSTDADGKLEGVSVDQFSALNVTAGTITASKVAVFDATMILQSSNLVINAGSDTPKFSCTKDNSTGALEPDEISISATMGTTSWLSALEYNGLVIYGPSALITRYQFAICKLSGTSTDTTITSGTISLTNGMDTAVITPATITLNASNLALTITGLPTSDPSVAGRVWVDSNGFLRLSSGT